MQLPDVLPVSTAADDSGEPMDTDQPGNRNQEIKVRAVYNIIDNYET